MHSVILAAGNGTRLKPVTNTMSKAMVPIANKPWLEWLVSDLEKFSKVVIVANKNQEDITNYFADKVEIAYQEKPLGTANAVQTAEEYVKGKFLVMNCDEIIKMDDLKKISKVKENTIGCFNSETPEKFGVLNIEDGIVKDIIEKPKNPESNHVNSGIYMFNDEIFNYIKQTKQSPRGEFEITDSIKHMIENGHQIKFFELSDWKTLSYPWHLLEANKKVLEEHGSMISEKAEIRPGAFIEGPVAIGEGSVVGPNCFIRKYSVIGKNCHVGNAVEIKSSIIMDNTFVSHLSFVGDSIICKNCNVGAGTIFANLRLENDNVKMKVNGELVDSGRKKLGSVVGENVQIGVNCTIMPGRIIGEDIIIPPCTMVRKDMLEKIDLR